MEFKSILKSLRTEIGLSQDQLAEKMKMSRSSIGMYEQGRRFPKLEELEAFADFFNVDMNYLLGKQHAKRVITLKNIFPNEIVDDITTFEKENETIINIHKELSKMDERKLVVLLAFIKTMNGGDEQ